MRFLSRVDLHVLSQAGGLCEGLATHLALVGPLSRVDSHVCRQAPGLAENFATMLAFVDTLATLGSRVPGAWQASRSFLTLGGVFLYLNIPENTICKNSVFITIKWLRARLCFCMRWAG